MSAKKLNLGAGKDASIEGAVTIDCSKQTHPDIIHDLNMFPWPFQDNEFDVIYARDVLEHLDDLVKTMEELHRISKPGAQIFITIPHYSCANAYTDPTHKQRLGFFSFDYFTGENQWDFYTDVRFQKVKAQLHFFPTWVNKLVWRYANHNPEKYERYFAWIFPAWYMSFELGVIK